MDQFCSDFLDCFSEQVEWIALGSDYYVDCRVGSFLEKTCLVHCLETKLEDFHVPCCGTRIPGTLWILKASNYFRIESIAGLEVPPEASIYRIVSGPVLETGS